MTCRKSFCETGAVRFERFLGVFVAGVALWRPWETLPWQETRWTVAFCFFVAPGLSKTHQVAFFVTFCRGQLQT